MASWEIDNPAPISNIKVSRNNEKLAYVVQDEIIRIHDLNNQFTGTLPPLTKGAENLKGRLIRFSADGQKLYYCRENTLYTWDISLQKVIHQYQNHLGGIQDFIFTENENTIIVVDGNRSIHIWDAKMEEEICEPWKHTSDIYAISLTPDERSLVSTDKEENITFWNFRMGQPLHSISSEHAYHFTFLNSGELLVLHDLLAGSDLDYVSILNFGKEWEKSYRGQQVVNK